MHRSIYIENDQSGLQGVETKTGLVEYKYREIFVLVFDLICTLLSEV